MQLPEITRIVQKLLAASKEEAALACLHAYLDRAAASEALHILILLESRHTRNEQQYTITRAIPLEEYQTEGNGITAGILAILEMLPASSTVETAEIEQLLEAHNLTKKQIGKILYSIPGEMQIMEPVICTIRIAPEEVYEAVLRDGLDEGNMTRVETLQRMSEVMKVELKEVGNKGGFEIIAITSDIEQIIYENEYTEWLYQVTPLKPGTHTLSLEVSVVEILKDFGERRKSIKTLVRRINVVTMAVPKTAPFEEGEQMDIAPSMQPQAAPPLATMPSAGATPEESASYDTAAVPPQESTTKPRSGNGGEYQTRTATSAAPKKSNMPRILGTVTMVALVAVAGVWTFRQMPGTKPIAGEEQPYASNRPLPEYEDTISMPGAGESTNARPSVGKSNPPPRTSDNDDYIRPPQSDAPPRNGGVGVPSTSPSEWEAALKINSVQVYGLFIANNPTSEHLREAKRRKRDLEKAIEKLTGEKAAFEKQGLTDSVEQRRLAILKLSGK